VVVTIDEPGLVESEDVFAVSARPGERLGSPGIAGYVDVVPGVLAAVEVLLDRSALLTAEVASDWLRLGSVRSVLWETDVLLSVGSVRLVVS
jgi:hypothetical protein